MNRFLELVPLLCCLLVNLIVLVRSHATEPSKRSKYWLLIAYVPLLTTLSCLFWLFYRLGFIGGR